MVTTPTGTRERLRAHALALFLERGYDETSVEDVAAAAGVSHMTFYRHFGAKEGVLLEDPYDDVIAAAVLAQDAALPTLEQVRLGFLAAWGALPEPADEETRARVRIIAGHAGLRARAWESNRRTADLVTAALVSRGTSDLEARVTTGACLGALMEALLAWGAAQDGRPFGPLVREALTLLAPPARERPAPTGRSAG